MASFFFDKTIASWSLAGATGFNAHRNDAPNPFNRPGNTRAQTRAEVRTSGRGRCKPGSDDEARILLRPVRRLQCAPKANGESIAHRM
jgi:hypothetical protein